MSLVGPSPDGRLRSVPLVTDGTYDMLEKVDRGTLDFAFVQGGFALERFPNVRQVAGLSIVPLNLLVRKTLYDAVVADLGALRSRTVNLGSGSRTGTYWLSRELLAFTGLPPEAYHATARTVDQLKAESDPSKLPDAVFTVTGPSSALVRHLAFQMHYQLVPLPYGEAFRGIALSGVPESPGERMVVAKEHVPNATIPAFAYGVSPPVPPHDVATIGSRLLLVTHRRTRPRVVVRVLETLLSSRWAKAVQPPLDADVLRMPPEAPWHPGAIEFRDRDQPIVTGDTVSLLSNALQIVIPFVGGLWFLRGWLKDRAAAGRERRFDRYFEKVSELERLGLASDLDGVVIEGLDRELSMLKDRALGQISGTLVESEVLATLLMAHILDARTALTERRRESRQSAEAARLSSPEGGEASRLDPEGPEAREGVRIAADDRIL